MRSALQRLRLDLVAPAFLALTIFVVACGSSSSPRLHADAQSARWLAIGALVVVALAYALARPDVPRLRWGPPALAGGIAALAAVSSFWSVEPRITFERAVTLALVAAIAALLAYASAGRPAERSRLLAGLTGGAALIAVAGLVLLAIDSNQAIIWSHPGTAPTRYRGMGENPNTVSLLAALASPAAAWVALGARTGRARILACGSFALIFGSLTAMQSRGAIVGAGVGLLFLAVFLPRRAFTRMILLAGAVAAIGLASAVASPRFVVTSSLPTQAPSAATSGDNAPAPRGHRAKALKAFLVGRDSEIGSPNLATQTFGGYGSSSGRLDAWKGAFHTAMERPLLGYGFGSEDRAFVDRYFVFQGDRPENSYLGWLLQLGFAGLGMFALLAVALLAVFLRMRRKGSAEERSVLVGLAAVALAGLAAAVTQSYIYSAGNIAMLTFWVAAIALAVTTEATPHG